MKNNSTFIMGALHPILFFIVVYGVSLFLAFFVCRMVFYSLNAKDEVSSTKVVQPNLKSTAFADNLSVTRYK